MPRAHLILADLHDTLVKFTSLPYQSKYIHFRHEFEVSHFAKWVQRSILNFAPRGKLWRPGAKFSPKGGFCPLGVKLSPGDEILSLPLHSSK
jgi:hypothetical protein